jgi:hypothetical protein
MKQKTFVFSDELEYAIITNHISKDLIKSLEIYYQANTESHVLGVLRHFQGKTIDYTDFIEKLFKDAPRYPQCVLRYSRTRYQPETINKTRNTARLLMFFNKHHEGIRGEWRVLNWRKVLNEQKKKSKDS